MVVGLSTLKKEDIQREAGYQERQHIKVEIQDANIAEIKLSDAETVVP